MRTLLVLLVLSLVAAATSANLLVNKLSSRDAVSRNASISYVHKVVGEGVLPSHFTNPLDSGPRWLKPLPLASNCSRRRCRCTRRFPVTRGLCSGCCAFAAVQVEPPSSIKPLLVRSNRVRRGFGSWIKRNVRKAVRTIGRGLEKIGASINVPPIVARF